MSAESVAFSTLNDAPSITGIVSDRIYPDVVPQEKVLPAIAFARVNTEYVVTIHSGAPVGSKVILEFWCLASKRLGAEDLADAVEPVIGPAGFILSGRRSEFDQESETWATVLETFYWN